MFDRYSPNKGRCVRYDYQAKGDRFTRGLSQKQPLVLTTKTHYNTGRVYKRRTHINEAQCLTIKEVLKAAPANARKDKAKLTDLTYYVTYTPCKLDKFTIYLANIKLEPDGYPLNLTVTKQHKGERLWFVCPFCACRAAKVYSVVTNRFSNRREWGCQKCLGLSYPSQYLHKNRYQDLKVLKHPDRVSLGSWCRAFARENRRERRLLDEMRRFAMRLQKRLG